MVKKVIAVLLMFAMLFAATSCSNTHTEDTPASGLFVSGNLKSVGDVYEFPDISQSKESGAPIIAGITNQVMPGDSITITGEGFSAKNLKVYLYAQNEKDNGKTFELKREILSDIEVVACIDESIKYGVYGVYIETEKGSSNVCFINDPEIWWIGINKVYPGEEVSIYGENLTTNNENTTNVWLIDENQYCKVELTYADNYKVTFTVPKDIATGKEYGVKLHNGHGGERGFATADEKVIVVKDKISDFSKGKVINVVDYGAKPEDENNDDSAAVKSAMREAKDGDTIYFPNGTYKLNNRISVRNSLRFSGENCEKTRIIMGDNVSSAIFYITSGPVEIQNLGFYEVHVSGDFVASMINYTKNSVADGDKNLYVHDCRFTQKTSYAAKAKAACIVASNTSGVIIKNNDFATTQAILLTGVEKGIIEGNLYYGQFYTGSNYNQLAYKYDNASKFDVNNNYFASADILTDDSHTIEGDDLINGRSVCIQGASNNGYIANNEIVCSGIPGETAGEQIMYEGHRISYKGGIESATENTITLDEEFSLEDVRISDKGFSEGSVVNLVLGKGVTQYRIITKIDGRTLTVDKPWDIIPDNTTTVTLSSPQYNHAIYKNKVSGYKNHSEWSSGGCGIMTYNEAYNIRMIDNELDNLVTGIYLTQHYREDIDISGSYWEIVSGNKITNCNIGIRYMTTGMIKPTQKDILMHTAYGITIRRNKFENIVDWTQKNLVGVGGYGILCGRNFGDYNDGSTPGMPNEDWPGEWMYGSVLENNTFKDCEFGNILIGRLQGKTLLRGNVASGKITNSYTMDRNNGYKPIEIK